MERGTALAFLALGAEELEEEDEEAAAESLTWRNSSSTGTLEKLAPKEVSTAPREGLGGLMAFFFRDFSYSARVRLLSSSLGSTATSTLASAAGAAPSTVAPSALASVAAAPSALSVLLPQLWRPAPCFFSVSLRPVPEWRSKARPRRGASPSPSVRGLRSRRSPPRGLRSSRARGSSPAVPIAPSPRGLRGPAPAPVRAPPSRRGPRTPPLLSSRRPLTASFPASLEEEEEVEAAGAATATAGAATGSTRAEKEFLLPKDISKVYRL
mmetsp:Transcript_32820/g.55377  ORF Transcript_32820/g.55377 Transcript_32820/m.55377 type:complete len:268 (-) Transcript_32820:102-905(-)